MSDEHKPLVPGKNVSRDSILHPSRPYVPSHKTNIAETFARIRAEQAAKPTPFKRRSA